MKIDDVRLVALWNQGLPPASMAIRLGATTSGVHQAIRRLGLRSAKTVGGAVTTPLSGMEQSADGGLNCGT